MNWLIAALGSWDDGGDGSNLLHGDWSRPAVEQSALEKQPSSIQSCWITGFAEHVQNTNCI